MVERVYWHVCTPPAISTSTSTAGSVVRLRSRRCIVPGRGSGWPPLFPQISPAVFLLCSAHRVCGYLLFTSKAAWPHASTPPLRLHPQSSMQLGDRRWIDQDRCFMQELAEAMSSRYLPDADRRPRHENPCRVCTKCVRGKNIIDHHPHREREPERESHRATGGWVAGADT